MAKDPDGKWLIAGAIVAQIAGYLIMRRITNIKV
jgi:Flp pilus assembly protein TadB